MVFSVVHIPGFLLHQCSWGPAAYVYIVALQLPLALTSTSCRIRPGKASSCGSSLANINLSYRARLSPCTKGLLCALNAAAVDLASARSPPLLAFVHVEPLLRDTTMADINAIINVLTTQGATLQCFTDSVEQHLN